THSGERGSDETPSLHPLFLPYQKLSLAPNSRTRPIPAAVTAPKPCVGFPLASNRTVVLMAVNDGWFNTLNDSARNCRRVCSWILKFFEIVTSHSLNAGPVTMFRPLVPNLPCTICAGAKNASVSNQRASVRWLLSRFGFLITLARVELAPILATSLGTVTSLG